MSAEILLGLLKLGQAVSDVIAQHREAARSAAKDNVELLALIDRVSADYDQRIAARERGE